MLTSRASPKFAAGCQSIRSAKCCTRHFSIQPTKLTYTGFCKSGGKDNARLALVASLGSSRTGPEASLRGLHVLLPLANRVVSPWLQPKQLTRRLDADGLTRVVLAWSILPALLLAVQPFAANNLAAGQPLAWQVSQPMAVGAVTIYAFRSLRSPVKQCVPSQAGGASTMTAETLLFPTLSVPPAAGPTV
jgi:hypothetical protein